MLGLLKELRPELTVHGMRSAFRNWAAEKTNFPRHVCEYALAHSLKDETEAAYDHSDYLEKRVPLMKRWADHCKTKPATAKVVKLAQA